MVGGSSSQTPEQFAVLVPDFDLLIKGDADEVMPRIAKIIGSTPRSQGLNERQIEEIKRLPEGILARTRNRRLSHNIQWTNVPSAYHLPRPYSKKSIYYWQTSRGAPYDCHFCNAWSGKGYRFVTPWEDDPQLSLPQRSAKAMKDWLVARLASEFLHDELNEDYISVIDGFTTASFFADWQRVTQSRHNLDASETIGLGHGPGMAIGSALATNRSRPLFVVMGDGAMGAGGMDMG